jgi:transposase
MTNLQQFADFTDKKVFVGIDVHKNSWNITLFYENHFLRAFTQPPSVEALNKVLRKDYPGAEYLCGYESGFSGFWIKRHLTEKGINCHVLHAADIPKTNKQKTTKTDTVDSRSIAQALSAGTVSSIYVPDLETESHRSLVRYRKRLQRDICRCKNRIQSLLMQFGYTVPEQFKDSRSKKFIKWLKAVEIDQHILRTTLNHLIEQLEILRGSFLKVNKDIRQLQQSAQYSSLMATLTSVPGIGPLTAITLITEIADIRRFGSFRQLNSFVGLYPMEYSSGEHEYKGKITVRHNVYLRELLVESAWTAIHHDPALLLVFEEWKRRMTAKRAIVKIARKLLSRIRYVWINETTYVKGIVK